MHQQTALYSINTSKSDRYFNFVHALCVCVRRCWNSSKAYLLCLPRLSYRFIAAPMTYIYNKYSYLDRIVSVCKSTPHVIPYIEDTQNTRKLQIV